MASQAFARIRQALFQLHLWVAIILCLLLVPLGLSGVGLAWPDFINRTTNPPPKVAASDTASLTPTAYLDAARAALPGARLQALRLPAEAGDAVSVTATSGRPGPSGAKAVWLDPATGRTLKIGSPTSRLYAWSHDFHETLMIEGIGNKLVGYLGFPLLLLSLSGLWLWWPRGAFAKAFNWRRTPQTLMNLHHLVGFWIALPLAFVSATGIGIVFPKLAAPFVGGGPPPAARPPGEARPAQARPAPPATLNLAPEQAIATAMATHAGARLVSVTLPGGAGRPGAPPQRVWRVDLSDGGAATSVRVDDISGEVSAAPAQPAGPPGGSLRRVHGGADNLLWKVIVTLTGFAPLVLALTGVITWALLQLRKSKARQASGAET
jgi:uncharacterized iron-regulated membrane protein